MPTNYERTKVVLDTLDGAAQAAAGGSVDAGVKASLAALSAAYPGLMNPARAPIDYSSAETHVAYAFRCLASHADLLYRTLSAASEVVLRQLTNDPIKIACIGGGPGSDALGFVKFAERYGLTQRRLDFVFLDREPAWQAVRDALFPTFAGLAVTSQFIQTDLAGGHPWTPDWSFQNADIFTLSFALSEVWAFNTSGSVSGFLDALVGQARTGALFAYTDNGGGTFLPLAEGALKARADIEEVFAEDDTWMLIGADEQQSEIAAYVTRFGQESKKTGNVNRRLWIKV